MHIVLLAQCITEECAARRDNRRFLSAAGRKKVLNLAAYLGALGHQVSILSNSYAKASHPTLVEELAPGITVHHAPTWAVGGLTPWRRVLATLFNLRWLRRRHGEVDLAITYNYHLEFALPALWARRFLGLPFVLDFEDGLYLVRHYRRPLYRWIEQAVYRSCAGVVAVNPGLQDHMRRMGHDKPTAVIHGLFNAALPVAPTPAPGTHQELLFAGNYSRGFGFEELLRYVAACPVGWVLNICGRGGASETQALRSLCEGHERARFLGFVPDQRLADLQQRAMAMLVLNDAGSAFNLTNFPSKLFDLLSAGKLVLSTRNPLLADYADLRCIVLLDDIDQDLPDIARRLAEARFDAGDVLALHARMLDRLRAILETARRDGPSR